MLLSFFSTTLLPVFQNSWFQYDFQNTYSKPTTEGDENKYNNQGKNQFHVARDDNLNLLQDLCNMNYQHISICKLLVPWIIFFDSSPSSESGNYDYNFTLRIFFFEMITNFPKSSSFIFFKYLCQFTTNTTCSFSSKMLDEFL